MTRLRLAAAALLCLFVCAVRAQITVSSSSLQDSSGNVITNATISFAPVDLQGHPTSYRKGTGGQVITRAVTAQVTSGAFTIQLPDTSVTNPANVCFAVTVTDNLLGPKAGSLLGPGYGCVQPSSVASNWCSGSACSFDAYIPNNPALPVTTIAGGGGSGGSGIATSVPASGIAGQIQPSQINLGNTYAGTSASAALATCGSSPCTWLLTGAATVSSSATLPSTMDIVVAGGGSFSVGSGATLAINGQLIGGSSQVFSGAGSVSFGNGARTVNAQWFGTPVYASSTAAATGTDSASALTAALSSLTLSGGCVKLPTGYLRVASTLTITTSAVGLCGSQQGYPAASASTPASVLVFTNPAADMLDITGTGMYAGPFWNAFQDFAMVRSAAPTGTTYGINDSFTCGVTFTNVQVQDGGLAAGVRFHAAPSCGTKGNFGLVSQFGFTGLGYGTGSFLKAFFLDSGDGNPENTLYCSYCSAGFNANDTGINDALYEAGTAMNDVSFEDFVTANASYALYLTYSGTGNGRAADNHFDRPILDACTIACVYVSGFNTANGLPTLTVDEGYMDSNVAGGHLADFENSTGVLFTSNQLLSENASTSTDLVIANNSSITISNNMVALEGTTPQAVFYLHNAIGTIVNGNNIPIGSNASVTYDILFDGTTSYSMAVDNMLSATTTSAAIGLVPTTQKNGYANNVITNSTTHIIDVGTGNGASAFN